MEVQESRRILRSSISVKDREAEKEKEKQKNETKKHRPYIRFTGKVTYSTTLIDCAIICDNLLKIAQDSKNLFVLGFDMEWPFSYKTGPGKSALIQISPNLDTAHLLHIYELKSLPMALIKLLVHPNVRLAGVNIRNDIHKLGRDFPGLTIKPMLKNCVDSRVQASSVSTARCWSMERLVNYFLNMEIDKNDKVRKSKWNIIPLTPEQQIYAACDSFVSLKLYLHLKEMEDTMQNIENNGIPSMTIV